MEEMGTESNFLWKPLQVFNVSEEIALCPHFLLGKRKHEHVAGVSAPTFVAVSSSENNRTSTCSSDRSEKYDAECHLRPRGIRPR
jgi:hypothetical protein